VLVLLYVQYTAGALKLRWPNKYAKYDAQHLLGDAASYRTVTYRSALIYDRPLVTDAFNHSLTM